MNTLSLLKVEPIAFEMWLGSVVRCSTVHVGELIIGCSTFDDSFWLGTFSAVRYSIGNIWYCCSRVRFLIVCIFQIHGYHFCMALRGQQIQKCVCCIFEDPATAKINVIWTHLSLNGMLERLVLKNVIQRTNLSSSNSVSHILKHRGDALDTLHGWD